MPAKLDAAGGVAEQIEAAISRNASETDLVVHMPRATARTLSRFIELLDLIEATKLLMRSHLSEKTLQHRVQNRTAGSGIDTRYRL